MKGIVVEEEGDAGMLSVAIEFMKLSCLVSLLGDISPLMLKEWNEVTGRSPSLSLSGTAGDSRGGVGVDVRTINGGRGSMGVVGSKGSGTRRPATSDIRLPDAFLLLLRTRGVAAFRKLPEDDERTGAYGR